MKQTQISVISHLYTLSAIYIQPHIINFTCTLDLEVFNFSVEITCFAFYFVLWTESIQLSSHSTNLKRRCLDLLCNYYYIHCVCNHSTALVVIFFFWLWSKFFWHFQNFIVNLDTMPLINNLSLTISVYLTIPRILQTFVHTYILPYLRIYLTTLLKICK
jgi:hypothetical protein